LTTHNSPLTIHNLRDSRTRGPALRAVLFDWDGTLLDSAEASFSCYVRVFGQFGIPFTRERFGQTYAPDWYRTYEAVGLPREVWKDADSRWLELYARENCGLLPGVGASIDKLRRAGLATALVTSGSRARVEREIARLELAELLDVIVCAEDARQKKPHPEALSLALARLSVAPAEAVFVGDSPEDVVMARAAGVASLAIAGGFPNRSALEASRPDIWAADLEEAASLLLG
jgi:HAD superfamily hydrolase (TIGR01509 family)